MTSPVLSICIPTYNRSACLRECLDSILSSAKGYEDKIEIVISDNDSIDDTASVVKEYESIYPLIRYYKNDTNIGADKNVFLVAELGLGEYIWVSGDDDKVTSEAIPAIMNRIESGYNLIICNYSVWSRDFSNRQRDRAILIDQDREYTDANLLLEHFGSVLGFMSIRIMKKSTFFSIPLAEYEPYVEYGFGHVYCTYAGIAKDCNVAYISEPVVCNRADNTPIQPLWNKFFITGFPMIIEALTTRGYRQKSVNFAMHKHLLYITFYIVRSKSTGDIDSKDIARLLFSRYKKDWLFWVICIPVLFVPVPKFLLRFMVGMARRVLGMVRKIRS